MKQIKPGDIYYKNNNCVKMAICNPRSINRKEEVMLHHCVTEDLDFCLLTEKKVKEGDCSSVNRLRKAAYWCKNISREDKIEGA